MVCRLRAKRRRPDARRLPPGAARIARACVLDLGLQPLDAPAPSSAGGDRQRARGRRSRRPAAAGATASARPPHDKRQTRVAPLNRSHAGDRDDADHARSAARACRRRPTDRNPVDLDQPQAARSAPAPCAAAAAPPPRRVANRIATGRSSQTTRFASASAASISARRDLARQIDRRRLGAEMKAHRPHAAAADRTRPTARAGRCAAACDRSGAASRSRRARAAPGASGASRRRARSSPSSSSTTSTTRAPPSAPGVERLAARRRIERRAIEHDRRDRAVRQLARRRRSRRTRASSGIGVVEARRSSTRRVRRLPRSAASK